MEISPLIPTSGVGAYFKVSHILTCMSKFSLRAPPTQSGPHNYINHTAHSEEYRPGAEAIVNPGSGLFGPGGPGFRVPRAWSRIGGHRFQVGTS